MMMMMMMIGLPLHSIRRLQLVQNSLARVVVPSTRRFHPITPVLCSLHWLPIPSRIDYKIASITFKIIHNHQPTYLHQLLTPYVPTRLLRSSDQHLLVVPSFKLVQSRRSFSSCCSYCLEFSSSYSSLYFSS